MARRLTRWGAAVTRAATASPSPAASGTGTRCWSITRRAQTPRRAAEPIGEKPPRRIVLITPGERHGLPALKDAGFTGYLVKPVRAASLAAQLTGGAVFEDVAAPAVQREHDASRQKPRDPGRRGQRDQRAAGPLAAGQARPSPDRRGRRRDAVDAWRAAQDAGAPLRPGADGRAHAGHRRPRSDAPHPRRRGGRGTPHADRRAHRQCLRRGSRGLPRRRHGRFPGQAARPRAARRDARASVPHWRRSA